MNLLEESKKVNWQNGSEIIQFYESRKLYFSNANKIQDEETLYNIINVKYHYANSLFFKSHYDKVYPIIEEARELISIVKSNPEKNNQLSTVFLFLEARTLNNQKKYRKAQALLKELLKKDPDNHTYQEWYLNNTLGTYEIYFNVLIGIAIVLIWSSFVISFSIDLGLVGIIMLVLVYFGYEGFKRRIKSKLSEFSI